MMRMRMKMRMRMTLWINKKGFFWQYIKIGYYWFNRQKILQKAKERHSKEKAAEYYLKNKEAIKEKARHVIKTYQEKRKPKLKSIKKKDTKNWFSIKKKKVKRKK